MNQSRIIWLVTVCLLLAAGLFLLQCSDDSDDDDDTTPDNGDEQPPTDQTMVGWAFGDSIYRYSDGYWREQPDEAVTGKLIAAAFINRDFGYAISEYNVYRYNEGVWSRITPPDYPLSAAMFDIAIADGGVVWFAARDPDGEGYLIKHLPTGENAVFKLNPTISTIPVLLKAILAVPGDPYLHMVAEVEGYFQHWAWNEQDKVTDIIIANDPENPTVEINDLAIAPDGALWAAGWDLADELQTGVFWRRGAEAWDRRPAMASTDCRTTSVRKVMFTDDGIGYALADCIWSQIYRSTDASNWTEMSLPGDKGEEFVINDISLISDTKGWAVGYTSVLDEPLLLLRNESGWNQSRSLDTDTGHELNAVAIFDYPLPGGVDDDTLDDDTADDDTGDDDTGDDDTGDDDSVDDDTTLSN